MIMYIDAEIEESKSQVVCPYPPTPQHCLFFYINDRIHAQKEGGNGFTKQAESIIVGPQLTRVNLIMGRSHRAICVGFHPGGLYRLLGIPMAEIFDEGYDATEVIGREMNSLNEALKETITSLEAKQVVEDFLIRKLDRLKTILPFDLAMRELLRYDGKVSIEKLASFSCLSLRQFERKCRERIGLPPKVFARLIRFSKAYRLKELHPALSWAGLAYECGYFDQMHLIRDFKEFAGVTPTVMDQEWAETPFRLQAKMKI